MIADKLPKRSSFHTRSSSSPSTPSSPPTSVHPSPTSTTSPSPSPLPILSKFSFHLCRLFSFLFRFLLNSQNLFLGGDFGGSSSPSTVCGRGGRRWWGSSFEEEIVKGDDLRRSEEGEKRGGLSRSPGFGRRELKFGRESGDVDFFHWSRNGSGRFVLL